MSVAGLLTRAPEREPSAETVDGVVPAARRHRRPGWRDPRILVGLVIVLGSLLLGARVLGSADDTVGVWAVRTDLTAGAAVTSDDLVRVRVRFTDADQADRYLVAADRLPAGAVLSRPVAQGELLPRGALDTARPSLVEVPLAVAVDDLPTTVRQGSRIDVWVTPQAVGGSTTADHPAGATRVLADVTVVEVPQAADSLAPSGTRQVIVGVTRTQADDLGSALGQTAQGRVVVTRRE